MRFQVLVCIVFHGLVAVGQGLQISIERTPGQDICARLQCWNDVIPDFNIFNTTSITILDVSQPDVTVKLASVSVSSPRLYVNPSRIPDVNGTGSISRYHANLTLTFRNDADCVYGNFQCVLEFVNVQGQTDTLNQTTAPARSGCGCYILAHLVGVLERELPALRLNRTLVESELSALIQLSTQLEGRVTALSQQVSNIQNLLTSTPGTVPTIPTTQVPSQTSSSCDKGMAHTSARQKFLLWGRIQALCDTETDGGGWVIIQRRTGGVDYFYTDWDIYKFGFGTVDTGFWIGNDIINILTQSHNELRVDMELDGVKYYAHYSHFYVDRDSTSYRLSVSGYSGSAGDSLSSRDGATFSTNDGYHDADAHNCNTRITGGWWYKGCDISNINGVWGQNDAGGVIWETLSSHKSLTFTEMKVRQA